MFRLSLILILILPFVAKANDFDQKLFLKKAKLAPIVVVAEVTENKRETAFWSGLFAVTLPIRYEVKEILKGKIEKGSICATHYIVANSRIADANEPRISATLFNEGNKLILLLDIPDSQIESNCESLLSSSCNVPVFVSPDENYGAVLAETKLLELTRKTLEKVVL